MTKITIDHVQVAMPFGQEEQAGWFYGGPLGLSEIENPESVRSRGGVWFASGNLQLHLDVEEPFSLATKAHVCYVVPSLEQVGDRLHAAGCDVNDDRSISGVQRFFTADPFGNRVEVLSPITEPE